MYSQNLNYNNYFPNLSELPSPEFISGYTQCASTVYDNVYNYVCNYLAANQIHLNNDYFSNNSSQIYLQNENSLESNQFNSIHYQPPINFSVNNSFYPDYLSETKTGNLINSSIPILEKESIIQSVENKFFDWEKFIPNHFRNENHQPDKTPRKSLLFSGLPNEDPHLFLTSLEHSARNSRLNKDEIFNILHTVLDNDPLYWFLHEKNSNNLKNYYDFTSAFIKKYEKPSVQQNKNFVPTPVTSLNYGENNSLDLTHSVKILQR